MLVCQRVIIYNSVPFLSQKAMTSTKSTKTCSAKRNVKLAKRAPYESEEFHRFTAQFHQFHGSWRPYPTISVPTTELVSCLIRREALTSRQTRQVCVLHCKDSVVEPVGSIQKFQTWSATRKCGRYWSSTCFILLPVHFCGWLEADSVSLQWGQKPIIEKKWCGRRLHHCINLSTSELPFTPFTWNKGKLWPITGSCAEEFWENISIVWHPLIGVICRLFMEIWWLGKEFQWTCGPLTGVKSAKYASAIHGWLAALP
jgi:hypothetical protein